MNKSGRKGFGEELKIVERYSALTEPFFKVIQEMLASEEKADKKWAVEQLNKAYTKMIPQDITTGGDKLEIIPIYGGLSKHNGSQKDIQPDEENKGS